MAHGGWLVASRLIREGFRGRDYSGVGEAEGKVAGAKEGEAALS